MKYLRPLCYHIRSSRKIRKISTRDDLVATTHMGVALLALLGLALQVPPQTPSVSRRQATQLAASAAFAPFAAVADRGKDLYESDRKLLSGGTQINENVALPEYDEEGRIVNAQGYAEIVATRRVGEGKASVEMLKQWVQSADGAWADPVTGSAASSLRFTSKPSSLSSITDAGKPERLKLVDVLGLAPELTRADMVAAAVRKVDGVTYYDYDLALPAEKCVAELATACLPDKVVLLSCGVRAGSLHIFQLEASPDQWRRAGRSIKELRSTFAVDA